MCKLYMYECWSDIPIEDGIVHSTRHTVQDYAILSRNLAIWYDMATQAESYMYQYERGNMSLIIPVFPCYDFETIIPTS